MLFDQAASLYVAQDGLNRALDAEFGAVDAQIIVLRVAPGLIAVVLIEAGTILIDFLDLLACLSLIKTLTLLKALDARVGVAEDKDTDHIIPVVEDIVGAATDEDAVFLGCDLADRVELCAALMGTGGLTPSFGMIQACSHVGVPQGVQVLIRPRGGSFVFTDEEKYVQIADVRSAILAGASGVVVGGMTEDGRIDVPFTRALAEAARNEAVRCNRKVQVTYHRAFDMLDDQFAALDTLIELGFTRVLTSGGAACVPDGLGRLRELSEYAAGRIQIQAGGGVTVDLIPALKETGVSAIHLSAKRTMTSDGGPGGGGDGVMVCRTDRDVVRTAVAAAR